MTNTIPPDGSNVQLTLVLRSAQKFSISAAKTETARGRDSVQISEKARNVLSSTQSAASEPQGIARLLENVNNDPKFADKMAYVYSHTRDYELVDLKDVPLSGNSRSGPYKSMDAYQKHTDAFETQASSIMNQRMKIYNEMKAGGAAGLEIFKSIMQFNKSLPLDYQKAAGLDKYSEYVTDSAASSPFTELNN